MLETRNRNLYRIEYVELDNKKPFEEFLNAFTLKEQEKLITQMIRFLERKNANIPVKGNISKYLEDGIFEVRIFFSDKSARTLYYYEKGGKIIFTHGFIKKTQKTPRKEIEYAKQWRKKYNKRMGYD